ncbi:MAG: Maf family protein [Trueperaceae bacterium]
MSATVSPPLVLASASPRRRELLSGLGLSFEIDVPDVDETPVAGEAPDAMVLRLARSKARAVAARRHPASADAAAPADAAASGGGEAGSAGAFAWPLVIAADTTVVLDGESLGKPRDVEEAAAFVARLSGRDHWVHTGHALRLGEREATVLRSTRVRFRPLDAAEIADYAATGEGLDKAGGYAIQGLGATLIDAIDGCYGAVVGLSLPAVLLAARELGVRLV